MPLNDCWLLRKYEICQYNSLCMSQYQGPASKGGAYIVPQNPTAVTALGKLQDRKDKKIVILATYSFRSKLL